MNGLTLVCFAVSQEAKPFREWASGRKDIQVIVTGMGASNAERAISEAFERFAPHRVFSCGFAGALDSSLHVGDLVFDSTKAPQSIADQLLRLRVSPASFYCAARVAITAAEKSQLRRSTGASAVEMESKVIQAFCAARNVDCVTLRVISDTADEDLPLDFNALMTSEQKLSGLKLAFAILRSPQKIPHLIRLGRDSAYAANELSRALISLIGNP
jgi:adenosylhomocysteine nucleosidase